MPRFDYKGRDRGGSAITGQLEAASTDSAANQLLNSGVTPIEITENRPRPSPGERYRKWRARRRPRLDDMILFARQLYTLMRSGVPIIRALNGLADNIDNPYLQDVIHDLVMGLESGLDLSGAMARHPQVFSDLFISMVQVGEHSGNLDAALLQLSEYLEREKETADRIKTAMRYPTFVVVAIAIAIGVINFFVIPTFTGIFDKFDAELPWQTRLLVGMSNFTIQYWYLLAGGLIVALIAVRAWLKTPKGKLIWDRYKLKLPAVGIILHYALLQRFATAFAMTQRSGVPLLQGLTVVANAVDNAYVEQHIHGMRTGVEQGESLTRTATNSGMFTPLILQMIAVGEESGSVDEMLDNIAVFYGREVDYRLKYLSSALEPILIVILGAMVFLLALGVFLPMWDLMNVVRGN
ncbi:type II secretion system F family protein [Thiohalophilus thiocyanatoxydans]|uniref:MSHA biogenesis protein MshG n=1 Tax=Thiohalophilus thiocyanatoxydans TaxID=381308 RepID=A0A4R8ITT8_9GAMM|nr:type II secretion system F family protein [Thiohalophilus thiocyanatoxydans]TDY03834.1 MSHA biogenesis protein MshG [Thiohalophilus thiocyanatoxydans]